MLGAFVQKGPHAHADMSFASGLGIVAGLLKARSSGVNSDEPHLIQWSAGSECGSACISRDLFLQHLHRDI